MTNYEKKVTDFGFLMMQILEENDYKGGWNNCSLLWLFAKLSRNVGDLAKLMEKSHFSFNATDTPLDYEFNQDIQRECADIANLAMMIADRANDLEQQG